jgi:hypothetical protein
VQSHWNFRREDCHADVDKQHNGCQPSEQSDYQQRAADCASANKRPHNDRTGDADLGKAAGRKFLRVKKLLNALGPENAADQEPHENAAGAVVRKKRRTISKS